MNNFLIIAAAIFFLLILWVLTYRNILLHSKVEISLNETNLREKFFTLFNELPYLIEMVNEHAKRTVFNFDEMLKIRNQLIDGNLKVEEIFGLYEKLYTHVEGIFTVDNKNLQSDIGFLEAKDELENLYNTIRLVVKEYNSHIGEYNDKLLKFPGNFIGGLFRMQSLRTLN